MQNKNKFFSKIYEKIAYLKDFSLNKTIIKGIIVLLFIAISNKALAYEALFLFKTQEAFAQTPLTDTLLIELTNKERAKQSLPPFVQSDLLTAAAYKKAANIITGDYFAHTTPEGKPFYEWIQEEHYDYQSAGENLAIAFTDGIEVMKTWMESRLHRENILDTHFQEIGIAVVTGNYEGEETTVIVQLFGEPIVPLLPTPLDKEIIEIATGSEAIRIATLGAYDYQPLPKPITPVFHVRGATLEKPNVNNAFLTILSLTISSLLIIYLIERTLQYERMKFVHRTN